MSRVEQLNGITLSNFYSTGSTSLNTAVLTKGISIYIPANTFKDDDVFTIVTGSYNGTGTAAWNTNLYWNTGNTLTGAIQISTAVGVTNTESIIHDRTFKIIDKSGVGSGTLGVSTDPNDPNGTRLFSTSIIPARNAVQNFALDWTKDSYLMVGFFGSSSQNISNRYMKIYTF